MSISKITEKYLGEKLGLSSKQLSKGNYAKKILKYYKNREKTQYSGASEIDGLSTAIIDYLKFIKEPYQHLSDRELKHIAKEILTQK